MYHSIDHDFIFYEAKSLFYDCLCNTETDLVKLQFSWKAISSVVSSVRDPSSESESCSVVSDSLRPHGLYSPWNSPNQNTTVGSLSLLQGIFQLGLPHCRQILYQLSHKGSPRILELVAYPFSSGSSWPRNQTGVSCIAGAFFTNWAMREALEALSFS